MATRRTKPHEPVQSKRRPATTPEARENQMISLAVALAEKQMQDGTASAQVISHYLKLGSSREKLEQAKLVKENVLLEARKEAIASGKQIEELYKSALDAMRSYAGATPELESEASDD
jgi:hypothetical protein